MTREPSQWLDGGHLAQEYREVISKDVVTAGERFDLEEGREAGHLQLLPSLLSGKLRPTHTRHDQFATEWWWWGAEVRGQL